jgi:type III restriction enzyme
MLQTPSRRSIWYWELDDAGQPTQKMVENRRSAKFITPIPKPKKRKAPTQTGFVFDEGKGLSTQSSSTRPRSSTRSAAMSTHGVS